MSAANLCGINTRTLQTGSLEISEVPFINPKEIMTCGIPSGTLSDASLICHHSLKMGSLCARTLSHFSRVRLFATPWTTARQAPLSVGFSQQEYWSGLPFPTPGYLPHPGIIPTTLTSLAMAGRFFTTEPPGGCVSITKDP